MRTLLLDTAAWDLCLDAAGNIAVADEPYALAQDAASEMRLFQGEYWYDTTKGIPYLTQVLGISPIPYPYLKSVLVNAALGVPDVTDAQVFIAGVTNRKLTGQVQISQGGAVVAATNITV